MEMTVPRRKKHVVREYGEALFTALLIAFFIRSFVIEAFKIPSGSMIPTLMIGDHIFVNKFTYGLRIPFTKKKIITFGTPQRGEAVVFIYPVEESKDFIKRVVGLPGDAIQIRGDDLIINGMPVTRQPVQVTTDSGEKSPLLKVIPEAVAATIGTPAIPVFPGWRHFNYFIEKTGEVGHFVQFDERPSEADLEFVVPQGHLFVMGDNRDNSSDSRDWGFVPMENVKGRALFVWLSIDYDRKTLRWNRFGKWIR